MVKQIFRVDKRQFKILNTAPEYDMTTQVCFIFIMTALHNYIQDHAIEEISYFEEEINEETIPVSISNNVSLGTSLATSVCLNRKRNVITNKM